MNYKIKVENEVESKEVQELFFELGGSWDAGSEIKHTTSKYLYLRDGIMMHGSSNDNFNQNQNYKETTIQRLKDLVVLKRNSIESNVEQSSIDSTLQERESQYGSFVGVANTAGQLMSILLNSKNGYSLPYAHQEALHMICSKMARIVNGDYNHLDSWHDIGGYSKLIENLISEHDNEL